MRDLLTSLLLTPLLHITIVVLSTVMLGVPNPLVCPWMQHEKTANSVIFCQQLWKHPTIRNPIKIVLSTSTRHGGGVCQACITHCGWVASKKPATSHQKKYYTVPSLPPGPVTSPTANEGNISGLTQIMSSQGPKLKITYDNMKVL